MYSLPYKLYFESRDFLSTALDLRKLLILMALAENLEEDTVHVGQLAVYRKGRLNLFKRKKRKNFFIGLHRGTKTTAALPRVHGVCLHQLIGLFAKHPSGGQIEQ